MKLSTNLALLLLSSTFLHSSSLLVYQDKSIYNYNQKNTYIGFVKNVKAKCNGENVRLKTMLKCPLNQTLCQESNSIKDIQNRLNTIRYNGEILDSILKIAKPTKIDANGWIKSAKELAKEKSNLLLKEQNTQEDLTLKKTLFKKKVTSFKAIESENTCTNEFKLILPRNALSFSTSYEAEIDNKNIEVTQYLNILNRSGIDIVADSVTFYQRMAYQYVRPVHFKPWIVGKYAPINRKMKKSISSDLLTAPIRSMSFKNKIENIASYIDAREYKIDNLNLPSTGISLDIKVLTWSSKLTCKLKAYPYLRANAFEVCSFEPKYQIEKNSWKVKNKQKTINDNAVGEYEDRNYNIYTKRDDDLNIKREKIVDKERETGFFGGSEQKKDGFILTINNKSNKIKNLTVIERIPTSNTDEINVKLLSIKSNDKVNYKLLKDGKIEINLTLKAKVTKKIEILFELSYDKKLKVRY